MADAKVTSFPNYTTPISTDVLPIIDVTNSLDKKVTMSNLSANLQAITAPSANLTGLTASSAVATDSSKNLVSVTNTGSGNNVLATSPALVTVAETGIGTADLLVANNHAVTVTSNAGTCSQSFLVNTFTNSSAATMAITLSVTSPTPKDGQFMVVRIYDFSGVAQTIGWTNTENSTVSVPTTSNGSTTLPLSVCFMYNASTSKWRCVASA